MSEPLTGELVGMILRFRSDGSDDSESLGVIATPRRLDPALLDLAGVLARQLAQSGF